MSTPSSDSELSESTDSSADFGLHNTLYSHDWARNSNSSDLESTYIISPAVTMSTPDVVSEEEVEAFKVGGGDLLRVSVKVEEVPLEATIDTAAEVTIISDLVFRSLPRKPPTIKKVTLTAAGRDMKLKSMLVGPVCLQLGSTIYQELIHVAPIVDTMLLGLDFLTKHNFVIDAAGGQMKRESEVISCIRNEIQDGVGVLVTKRVTLPPMSVSFIACYLDRELPQFMIEPDQELGPLFAKSIHSAGRGAILCAVNVHDRNIRLRKDMDVARAFPGRILEPARTGGGQFVGTVKLGHSEPLPPHLQEVV